MKAAPSYCHIYGQLDQTGDRFPEELAHLFSLGLTCDISISFTQAKKYRHLLADLQQRGGLVAPNIYPRDLDDTCIDSNWWKYSEEECTRLLKIAQDKFSHLNLGPLLAVNTYTPGNTFVSACRKLGIHYILGFCAPTVIEDGGWSIAHYGSPLSPYFISEEDYRKPENPSSRQDSVMMLSMELRNPITCLNHWSEGPWCPLNALAADRWLEPSDEPLPFIAIAEDWLRQSELTGTPKFFHINLQYFFAGRCYEHNRRALHWLAEQRDKGRLNIGGILPWNEHTQKQQGFVPQTTYWRGEMMGFHVGHQAGSIKDVIVDESLEGQIIWEEGDPLPKRWYDYRHTWNYPPFEPTGTAPASETIPNIQITCAKEDLTPQERLVTITLHNSSSSRKIPLTLWEMLDGCLAPFEIKNEKDATVIPHPAGNGGAIQIKKEIPSGTSILKVIVSHQGLSENRSRKKWGQLLEAQTFHFQGKPYTVLVSQTPERFSVTVNARKQHNESILIESLCGIHYEKRTLPTGGIPLLFDASHLSCWHRFWNVEAADLIIEGVDLVEEDLHKKTLHMANSLSASFPLPPKSYQLFGPIRDTRRWDRELGRLAGDAEKIKINEWFRAQRPHAGEFLIEAHPGLHLPRGSITKVLGHEFDDIHCAQGFDFKELCADYPQGWDWGVNAWIQWRHLTIQVSGIKNRPENFTLHIHAFDPESRDISQRVHFFNPRNPKLPQLSVQNGWALPKGLDGRWKSDALCSIPIPEICKQWDEINIWISPLEKLKLHDWVAEQGAPGLFSHLWLTAEK